MIKKNFLAGLHLSVVITLAFGVCILIYLIARSRYVRVDWSAQDRVSNLSEETRKVLFNFGTDPIEIFSFFQSAQPEFGMMEELLKDYAAVDPYLKFHVIDPDRFPAEAKRHKIDSYGVSIIHAKGREVRIEAVSEQELTNALFKILRNQARTIFFVRGHREASLKNSGPNGYSSLLVKLKGALHRVHTLDLNKRTVLKDIDLLVWAGPHVDLDDSEIDLLTNYFHSGGRIILALDPVLPGEGIKTKTFLLKLGVQLGEDVVIDKLSKETGADILAAMSTEYSSHPALKDFHEAVFFPVARSVRKAKEIPDGLVVSELAKTSLGSWAETNLHDLENGESNYNEGIDLPGPISIAAIVEKNDGKGKIIVIGDSDFMNNTHIHVAGNSRLVTRIFNWLLEEDSLVKIKSRTQEQKLLSLSLHDQSALFLFSIAVVPSFFLTTGGVVYFWRKRYQ